MKWCKYWKINSERQHQPTLLSLVSLSFYFACYIFFLNNLLKSLIVRYHSIEIQMFNFKEAFQEVTFTGKVWFQIFLTCYFSNPFKMCSSKDIWQGILKRTIFRENYQKRTFFSLFSLVWAQHQGTLMQQAHLEIFFFPISKIINTVLILKILRTFSYFWSNSKTNWVSY